MDNSFVIQLALGEENIIKFCNMLKEIFNINIIKYSETID